ncbi:putative methyltransferase tdiE [Hyphodiscus hymeniophilus]|uniref:Methyltransferase tdiE n=1 Tax=Hyphodiscus hymeniophilus TaxID=353542 RepID=A0A9P6SNE2_9HELO|nr:putative methyltransferase tdiE [Hyphodiscus hymeniophilus]
MDCVSPLPAEGEPAQPVIHQPQPEAGLNPARGTEPASDKTSHIPQQQKVDQQPSEISNDIISNEVTVSTTLGSNIEAPITPPPHSKHTPLLDATGEADRQNHIPVAIFSPASTTGLDVDSNSNETDHSDADSAVGDSIYSSTYSTHSSVFDFVEENGRTYHRFKEGKYYLPNDEIERDRLDLQHHMCGLSFGALFLAPLDTIEGGLHDVLDIATGTGIWAIEFAEQFPAAVIKGTDLSPIQPDYVPPNLHFEVDDAEDPWVYSHKFDYIHGRMLVTCFQSHQAVFKSAFDYLRPGGYIELQDASFPFMGADQKWQGTAFQRWWRMLMDASRALGKDWNRVGRYKGYLEEVGFVDVVERKFPCPIGPWARGEKNKILGVWARANMLQSLGGLSMAILTRGLGMTAQEIELLLVDVRKDINKDGAESVHLYAPLYVVYGRKP